MWARGEIVETEKVGCWRRCGRKASMGDGYAVLHKLRSAGITASVVTYNSLLDVCARAASNDRATLHEGYQVGFQTRLGVLLLCGEMCRVADGTACVTVWNSAVAARLRRKGGLGHLGDEESGAAARHHHVQHPHGRVR